jgi:hypothetical protein
MNEYFIGQFVETTTGFKGIICSKDYSYDNYNGTGNEWFKAQKLPKSAKRENWYDILVDTGGAIYVPESRIAKKIKKVSMKNNQSYEFYFGGK